MEEEVWRDIPGYEGYYKASDKGRIKGVDRLVDRGNFKISIKGKIKKQIISPQGYPIISLCLKSKKKTYLVHRLIAMSFLNYKSNTRKIVIDHIDNNKTNNTLDNLQIITQRENITKDMFRRNLTSEYVGVSWFKRRNKWKVTIEINKKKKFLGYFDYQEEAALAYQNELLNIKV